MKFKKKLKTTGPCAHAILSYIDTQHNLRAIGSGLKHYLFIFWILFGVVKSDKGAELITFHILNIFIYFSRMVIGPGKRKALHH